MGVRRDVLASDDDREAYLRGCMLLANTPSGSTALDVHRILQPQVPGWAMRGDGSVELSMWDLFTLWHYVAMGLPTAGVNTNQLMPTGPGSFEPLSNMSHMTGVPVMVEKVRDGEGPANRAAPERRTVAEPA